MPCETVRFPNGGGAIICGARPRRKPCYYCGKPAAWLCDFFHEDTEKPCDRSVCADHRAPKSVNIDWCLIHVDANRRGEGMKRICSWCETAMEEGIEPATHGICQDCYELVWATMQGNHTRTMGYGHCGSAPADPPPIQTELPF